MILCHSFSSPLFFPVPLASLHGSTQVVLKASDTGLELSDGLLKLVPGEKAVPIVEGLRKVRSEAATVRKEGARQNGTSKVGNLEQDCLYSKP